MFSKHMAGGGGGEQFASVAGLRSNGGPLTMHGMSHSDSQLSQTEGRVSVWLATGWGLGLATPAPGTIAGGLWGLPLAMWVAQLSPLGTQLAAVVVACGLAVAICGRAASQMAQRDPQPIVLDEIVALPIVFLGVPVTSWPVFVVGFALFRLFDIWKPGLCKPAERLPGGWGVVADDVVAGVMGLVSLQGLLWVDWHWALGWFGQTL